jgi:hypothetical protein
VRVAAQVLVIAFVLALGLGACVAPGGPRAPERLVPYAPPGALAEAPAAPDIASRREAGPPSDGELPPNGAVADGFTAEGQVATYRFRARRGELSLFDLSFLGYARGWEAAVGIRILDGRGDVLLERERAGGASFAAFVPFVAPADGGYRFELRAARESCRYTILRHVGLAPNHVARRTDVGAGDRLIGYLADGRDRARLAFDLRAGESALVTVAPHHERNAQGLDRRRREALARALEARAHDGAPRIDALLAAGRRRTGDEPPSELIPELQLAGDTAEPEALLYLFEGDARKVALDVVALGASEGGLFQVAIERDPPTYALHGRVGDADDDPVAGARLYFLREPTLTPLAELETDAEGRFATVLPAGTYTVLFHAGPGTRLQRVEALLDGARELNVIYDGRASDRGAASSSRASPRGR